MKVRIDGQLVELEGSALGEAIKDFCDNPEIWVTPTIGLDFVQPWKLLP
jgi:hypothetical protein